MDQKIQTSFIPKKSLAESKASPGGIAFFTLVAFIIFIASIFASGGAYFYQRHLLEVKAESEKTLKQQQDSFDASSILLLIRLDQRIEAAKQILSNHLIISPLLKTLEESILKTVRFETMSYSVQGPKKITLSMKGQAANYASVAYQSDVVGEKRFIKNAIFSDLNLDQSGNISFNFNASIDPELLLYVNSVNTSGASPASN